MHLTDPPVYPLPELTDEELSDLRAKGCACWHCRRLLAAGAPCPEHGSWRPEPEKREEC